MIIIGELLSMTVFPPYRSGIYKTILTSRKEDDDGKVSNLDDNNCDSTNKSSCSRQPGKHGSASESIERTAWKPLPVSSCPTVVHWFEGSG